MEHGAGEQRAQQHSKYEDLPASDDWRRKMAELEAQDVAGPGAPRGVRRPWVIGIPRPTD